MMRLNPPQDELMRQNFRAIEQADLMNRKVNKDIEMGVNRIILTAPNGTRYAITVSNAGALSAVAV